MALTNAEKQRNYRKKVKENCTHERLQAVIDLSEKRNLERLAKHYCLTQQAMLEKLISEEVTKVITEMSDEEYEIFLNETVTV